MAIPIRQLESLTSYVANGTDTVWNFSFASGYLDAAHVKAYTISPTGVRADLVVVPADIIGGAQLSVVPAVLSGYELTIYRDTPTAAPLVDFADRAAFTEASLDTSTKQAIFSAAETSDALGVATERLTDVSTYVDNALTYKNDAAASAAAAAASAESINLGLYPTLASLIASTGSTLISYIASGAGAVARTLQAILRDNKVSVKGYGAVGDGSTDDTAAILACIAANPGKCLYFPAGTYRVNGTLRVTADNTILCGDGRGVSKISQFTANIDTVLFEPTTAGTSGAFLNTVAIRGMAVNHSSGVAAVATSGAAVRFRQCNGYDFHGTTVNDAFEGITIEGGQFGSLKSFRLFASAGAYAGAETALLHFRQAHIGGGVYQPCYTVHVDDYVMSAALLRDGCIRIANGDGILISSNGYVGNGKNCNLIVKADRDNSSVASTTIDGYYDCVGPGKTVNGVEIRADGFANSDVFMLKFGSQCIIGNGDGSGIVCRKPETAELTIGATIINMVGWAIDVEGNNGQTDVNILPSARISSVGTGGVTGAIRISTVKVLSMVGAIIGATTTVALKLVGSNGRVTLTGNTNNANVADLDRTGATFSSFAATGNSSSWTGAVANSWAGFNSLTSKSTPIDADEMQLANSASSWAYNRVTWANIKATLKTYFDTLYQPINTTGTITPGILLGGASVGVTYTEQSGTWTRVGNRIMFSGRVILSAKGSSTGVLALTGLPVTAVENNAISIRMTSFTNGLADQMLMAMTSATTTQVRVDKVGAGTGFVVQLADTDLSNTTDIIFSGVYRV